MNSSGLTLKLWSVGADAKYFFRFARFKLGGGLGIVHKNFYTFREGEPLMVTPIASSVTEIMTGADASLAISPTTLLMGDAYYGHHFAATGLNVKGAQHYTFSSTLQHATMFPWLFFSYFYRYDFVSDLLDYSGAGKSEEITAIIKSYQIGAMITCQF